MGDHSDIDHTGLTGVGGGSFTFSGARVTEATQNVNNITGTALTFGTEAYDTDAYHSGGNPTRLTAPATGNYRVSAGFWFGFSDANELDIFITLNGSTTLATALAGQTVHTGTGKHMNVSADIPLTSGQYVECLVYHDNGSTRAVTSAYFTIQRLDP